MIASIAHRIISTNPFSRLNNSQEPGIGRVGSSFGCLLINNLGRNVELSQLSGNSIVPLMRFDETQYPSLDYEQQFDLDIHCFLNWRGYLLAINHYGLIRFFTRVHFQALLDGKPRLMSDMHPVKTAVWPGDVERFAIAADRLISTSPEGYSVADAAQPGLLISAPLVSACAGEGCERLPFERHLLDWGMTSAVAANKDGTLLAVAAGSRLGVLALKRVSDANIEIEEHHCESVPFHVSFLKFAANNQLVAAGYDSGSAGADVNDWDSLGPGGWLSLDLTSWSRRGGEFGFEIAWGHGADPVVVSRDGRTIYGIDRLAGLRAWCIETGACRLLSGPSSEKSLGMAHAIGFANAIICGFNRDGYQVHQYRP